MYFYVLYLKLEISILTQKSSIQPYHWSRKNSKWKKIEVSQRKTKIFWYLNTQNEAI